MTVTEIIAIILTASSLVIALSVLWAKVVNPVKRVVKQVHNPPKAPRPMRNAPIEGR